MGKIVLIDGNSIINRAFYGMPDFTNSEGTHTGAVFGFVNILNRIINEESPDYIMVAFDTHAPTFRHKMYEAYKGTRKGMPDELREQVPVLKELLHAMDVKTYEQEGIEADDILGTLAKRYEKEDLDVTVVSGDRDLLQIVTDKIKVRIPKTKQGKTEIEDYYPKDVVEKYQVEPLGIIELKALMGDSSDNIPGVPKIGEKTATELLIQYKDIETLKEHISEISKKSVRETLEQNFDMAVLSKRLATIEINADVDVELSDCEYHNIYTKEAYPLFVKLGFRKLLDRFSEDDAVSFSGNEAKRIEIGTLDEFKNVLKKLKGEVGFFVSGENESVKFEQDGQAVLSFSEAKPELKLYCGDEVYITALTDEAAGAFQDFALAAADNANTSVDNDVEDTAEQVDITYITYDFKNVLRHFPKLEDTGFAKNKVFDILIAAYLLNPNANNYFFDEPFYKYNEFKSKLDEAGMYKLFTDIEMPLTVVLYSMEKEGVRILKSELKAYGEELSEKINELDNEIKAEANTDININSPKQLGELLFETMKIPGGKKTKTGYSTAAEILEKLAPDYPFIQKILDYRAITKLKSTFIDGMYNFIGADGRIHCKFNQTVTATGRISCSDPNLQNIPIRTEQGRLIRKSFVPKDGYIFVDADYSQIELRIMAHMSGDEKLIKAYDEAKDIHTITASEVFNVSFNEVTPLMRRNAKAVNFGVIYGISSFGLAKDLLITRKDAQDFIDNYFKTFPKVKEYLDMLVENAKKDGYVTTMFSRVRPMPELKSSDYMTRQFGERVARNAPIQGTAADIMKIAMINVYDRLKREGLSSKLILQVHDELLIETEKSEENKIVKILEEEMTGAASLSVRLEIDAHSGKNWYEAK